MFNLVQLLVDVLTVRVCIATVMYVLLWVFCFYVVLHHVLQNWDDILTHIFGRKFKRNAPLVKIVCSCGINEGAAERNNM